MNLLLCRIATRPVFSSGQRGNTQMPSGVTPEMVMLLINYTLRRHA